MASALVALSLLELLAAGPTAAGQRRLPVPQPSVAGPFDARLERGMVYATGDWVIVASDRPREYVPGDFNPLDFFDAPGAFGCELTVHGVEVYPGVEGSPPIQTRMFGNGAVPVLFASRTVFANAAADDVLTLSDPFALPSVHPSEAILFEATLHLFQGARRTMTETVAKGVLYEGGSLKYQVTEVQGTIRHISLEFR